MLAAPFTPRVLLLALAVLGCSGGAVATESAMSEPVGAFMSTAAANSDTLVSTVLARPAVARGQISSVAGDVLTASGSPGWSSNTFVTGSGTHYVRMLTGALRGQYLIITGNAAATLTVDAAGLNLASIAAGDLFEVTPFWTLGTLFPSSMAGTAFITTVPPGARQTELLFFDGNGTGINRSANAIYFFANGAWRRSGSSTSLSFDSTIIYPDSYFIIRNKATATSLSHLGRVQTRALGSVLEAIPGGQNDNFVSLAYPADVTLANSGLISSGAFAVSVPPTRADLLLVFDPSGTGYNRSASAIYFYANGAWRKSGASTSLDFGQDKLPAGSGFIIRKAAAASGTTWTYATAF